MTENQTAKPKQTTADEVLPTAACYPLGRKDGYFWLSPLSQCCDGKMSAIYSYKSGNWSEDWAGYSLGEHDDHPDEIICSRCEKTIWSNLTCSL